MKDSFAADRAAEVAMKMTLADVARMCVTVWRGKQEVPCVVL